MAKKPSPETAISVIPNVRNELSFGQADSDLAAYLGLNLAATTAVRAEQAVTAYNLATRHMVEAGLLLASVKAELTQEAFMALLDERGMAFQRAYELMRGAALAARLPVEQREQVLALSKSKVIALANASAAVVEAMLEDGEVDIDLIGVRELRQRIRDLEANLADTTVQRDTAEAEAEAAKKKLAKKPSDREDQVPQVVADIRAELMALVHQAELAIESIALLGPELMALIGGPVGVWADPTLRQAISGVGHLGLLVDGLVKRLCDALVDGSAEPAVRSYLTQREILETAKAWASITAQHQHEKALREWEREQERPRGKGRPSAKPEAPKGARS